MNSYCLEKYLIISLVLSSFNLLAQEQVPQKKQSFSVLFELFDASQRIEDKASIADLIIVKAKALNDTLKLAAGFYIKSTILEDERVLKYSDSIITLTSNLDNKYYPASSFIVKGLYYSKSNIPTAALDNFLLAYQNAIKYDNEDFIARCRYFVGVTKLQLGDPEIALDDFKDNLDYYNKKKVSIEYLNNLFSTAVSYNNMKVLDSMEHYTEIGKRLAVENQYKQYEAYFDLLSGIVHYNQGSCEIAEETIKRIIPMLQSKNYEPNLAIAYFYIGKIQWEYKRVKSAVGNFKRVDSITRITKQVNSNILENYQLLIEHCKNISDIYYQSIYTERYLNADSIIRHNYKHLSKALVQSYEIPRLKAKNETIIEEIQKDRFSNLKYIYMLLALMVVISLAYFLQIKKSKLYQSRFEDITMRKSELSSDQTLIKNKALTVAVPSQYQRKILKGLEEFERTKMYLKQDTTISTLSKAIGVNYKYISTTIKTEKGKTFNNYINDLRINHAIEKLENDVNFRKFSLIAIANELGFKKSETFSKAFKKVRGVTPSSYIKQLKSN